MALPTAAGTEDELEYSNNTEEDEEYVCLPIHESTKLEEEGDEVEEVYVCLSSHGSSEQEEEEEEMDEEQQVLLEGSLWSSF